MSGRMIDQNISKSKKVAKLSPKSLALFALLIPHFNAHGKMNGELHYIKGQICPLINWLPIKDIKKCLTEISQETNVKWFTHKGLHYLQSLNWKEHQSGLRRLGPDLLPDWSRSGPGALPPEVEVELEVEVDKEVEVEDLNICGLKTEPTTLFEEFWKLYPKRKGKKIGPKGDVLKAFQCFTTPDRLRIVEALRNYSNSKQVKEGFSKDPIRFLRKEYWKEWLEPEEKKPEFKGQGSQGHIPAIPLFQEEYTPTTEEVEALKKAMLGKVKSIK